MKDVLCQAFCASLDVRSVPGGYAVEVPYQNADGDPLNYLRQGKDAWRIEDDGSQIPYLEANGVDIHGQSRGQALDALLNEYGATFDHDAMTIRTVALRKRSWEMRPSSLSRSCFVCRTCCFSVLELFVARFAKMRFLRYVKNLKV